jgi:hypothetical protein
MKLLIPLLVTTLCNTAIAVEPRVIIPTLSLEQEIYISDNNGVINPNTIIRLKPSDNVKFYLSDGTELVGLVKETQELNKEMFKVFGDVQNKPNTGFGFVITKTGIFAGAVVFRETNTEYTLQYSEEAKGFMLIKSKSKKSEQKITKKEKKPLTDLYSVL